MRNLYWWIIAYILAGFDIILGIYFSISISGIIPTHYNFWGEPTAYGKPSFLYWMTIPIIHLSIVILLTLIYRYRWSIINKYPYLINIPAFMMLDGRLDENKRKCYIDRIYAILALIGIYIGVLMVFIEYVIGTPSFIEYHGALFTVGMIIFSIAPAAGILLYYRRIYLDYRRELKMTHM
jgi:uncharacterized membrane protein